MLLFVEMLRLWPDLHFIYGRDSILDPELAMHWHTGIGWSIAEQFSNSSITYIHTLAGIYLLLCISLLWHTYTRMASLLLLVLHHAFFLSDDRWSYGADYLAQTGLLICLLFYPAHPNHATAQRWSTTGTILLQCQLMIVYFFGGIGKLAGETWRDGEAVWKSIHQPFSGNLIPIPLSFSSYDFIWMISGWSIIVIELMHPIAWLGKRYRHFILYTTIALHIGIGLFIGLYHFAALMIWYNLCAWYYPYKHTTTTYKRTPLEDNPERVTSTT